MLDKRKLGTFVLGGIAGALAGILLAPKSGKELRGSITSRAGEARERSRETYFEAQERVQERIAEVRERSPRSEYPHPVPGDTTDPLPKVERAAPEPIVDPDSPGQAPAETPSGPPPLRDVSWDPTRPELGEKPDPEEVRRRIRETRSRLRARLDASEPEDAPGDHDE